MGGGLKNHTIDQPKFTGVARSVECFNNQGHNNFRILTLHVEQGVVMRMDVSDPYANFECISRLEYHNETSIIHLNNNWLDRKTLSK